MDKKTKDTHEQPELKPHAGNAAALNHHRILSSLVAEAKKKNEQGGGDKCVVELPPFELMALEGLLGDALKYVSASMEFSDLRRDLTSFYMRFREAKEALENKSERIEERRKNALIILGLEAPEKRLADDYNFLRSQFDENDPWNRRWFEHACGPNVPFRDYFEFFMRKESPPLPELNAKIIEILMRKYELDESACRKQLGRQGVTLRDK